MPTWRPSWLAEMPFLASLINEIAANHLVRGRCESWKRVPVVALELAGSALKQAPRSASLIGRLDPPALAVIARQAMNALRPARLDQVIQCIFFCGKPPRQRIKIHRMPRLYTSSLQNKHASKG